MTCPTRISVRRATVADLDVVVPLFEAYRAFYSKVADTAAVRAFLEARLERGESVVLLAELDPRPAAGEGQVAGFTQLYPSFSSMSLGAARSPALARVAGAVPCGGRTALGAPARSVAMQGETCVR